MCATTSSEYIIILLEIHFLTYYTTTYTASYYVFIFFLSLLFSLLSFFFYDDDISSVEQQHSSLHLSSTLACCRLYPQARPPPRWCGRIATNSKLVVVAGFKTKKKCGPDHVNTRTICTNVCAPRCGIEETLGFNFIALVVTPEHSLLIPGQKKCNRKTYSILLLDQHQMYIMICPCLVTPIDEGTQRKKIA